MSHLVVIVADTLRRLDSVRQLDPNRDTPFLRNLIDSSVCFENAVASSPWSMPSHWSLLNGIDPWDTVLRGTEGNSLPVPGSLSHYWLERGGAALCLSQNDLVSRDSGLLAGYSSTIPRSGVKLQRALAVSGSFLDMGMGVVARTIRNRTGTTTGNGAPHPHGPVDWCYSSLLRVAGANGRALTRRRERDAYLMGFNEQVNLVGPSKPIHAFINLMHTHEPYVHATTSMEGSISNGLVPTNNLALHEKNLRGTCTETNPLHAAYLESVRDLDHGLSQLFGVLRRTGVLDDALVVLVSDHGQALGEHGRFGHGWTMQDEVVRVPAYFWDTRRHHAPPSGRMVRDWVDHRHLHDIILDQLEHPNKTVESSVADALRERGPAISHFRGRPAAGFNLARRLAPRERIRIWQDGSEVVMYRPRPGVAPELLHSTGTASSELETLAVRILSRTDSPRPGTDLELSDADSRLESWGYN